MEITEDGRTWKTLLDILYPDKDFDDNDVKSFDQYEKLCIAADKYEMASANRILRLLVNVQPYPPVLLYALYSRLGDQFKKELPMVSTKTLSLNLGLNKYRDQLTKASAVDALRLLTLHKTRRDSMVDAMINRFVALGHLELLENDPGWLSLQYLVLKAMESKPDGSSLKKKSFLDSPALQKIWDITCASWPCDCGEKIVEKSSLRTYLLAQLGQLPKLVFLFS